MVMFSVRVFMLVAGSIYPICFFFEFQYRVSKNNGVDFAKLSLLMEFETTAKDNNVCLSVFKAKSLLCIQVNWFGSWIEILFYSIVISVYTIHYVKCL